MQFYGTVALLALVTAGDAATADEWRSRSIYQVMTDRYAWDDNSTTVPCNTTEGLYCGGTWAGITNNLDYIQAMGFTAVWISPITANFLVDTPDTMSYHGYWTQNMYELNDRFGTETDLQTLSASLHDRGMYLMVDIVANHMAAPNCNYSNIDYSIFTPFNDSSYYHLPYCSVDTPGASETDCWLGDDVVPLADLRTEDEDVQSIFKDWISGLVSQYSIDGLRLDSAANINADFFTTFCEAAGVFCMGEVYSGAVDYVCPYQLTMDSTLNYPIYFTLTNAFSATNGSLQALAEEMYAMQYGCKDVTVLGSFSENHDVPRFASYTEDLALAQNIMTYTMLADGVPIIYEGQEQHLNGSANPANREAIWLTQYNQSSPLYQFVGVLNLLRTTAIAVASNYSTYQNWVIYNTSDTIVTRKGFDGNQIIMVLTNDGSDGETRSFELDPTTSGFSSSETVLDVVSCINSTTNGTGWLQVDIDAGLPKAFYPAKNVVGTNLCASGNGTPTVAFPPSSTASPSSTTTKKSIASFKYQGHSIFYPVLVSFILAMAQYIML